MNWMHIGRVLALALAGLTVPASAAPTDGAPVAGAAAHGELVRDGVRIEFAVSPLDSGARLVEGTMAEVRFRVRDADSGQPVTGLGPGAWIDPALAAGNPDEMQKACKEKIGLYLSGTVGVRPMVDLNSYFLLLLNGDPSITVIDPVVSLAGTTSTYKVIVLKRAPMDWARAADGKRIFVSMPSAGQVAVIDGERFSVLRDVAAGHNPVRVALQPDGRYLWVGNDSRDEATGGVTVIDTASLAGAGFVPTGRGHHEIAFSEDSRHAFVSNRDSGTLSVVDVATLKVVRQLETGPQPISVAHSALARAVYVADGRSGEIRAYDAHTLAARGRIPLERGLGPLRFTSDGRFGFALNTFENTASVIDSGSGRVIHTLAVAAEPFQVTFTRAFAYIRGLASERVTMVNLATLGEGRTPIVQSFAAGELPPRLAGDLPLADTLATARDDAAVFVVNPADNTAYFYMEGMNAPMAGYPNRGFNARAATVIDRSMRESEPGVYSARLRLPVAGPISVALMLDRPRVLHCFSARIESNPLLAQQGARLRVVFEDLPAARAGDAGVPVRFRLRRGSEALRGVADVRLRYFLAPASGPREVPATEIAAGLYEARIDVPETGAYYLHVGAQSLRLPFGGGGYRSLRVSDTGASAAGVSDTALARAPDAPR